MQKLIAIFCVGLLLNGTVAAQEVAKAVDSVPRTEKKEKKKKIMYDSTYNPNKAVIRSLIVPGWGQVTNKKYWKVPIVYGALGTTGYLFFRNIRQYRDSKQAYILATDGIDSNDYLIKQPYYSVKDQPERIRAFRNSVRQNVDYCVLFFIAFWGLNVADAAVDAHLKTFDVSDDLSLQIKAGYSPVARTNGVSLVLNIGK
ncbi:MAG: DUF5683 domain-containing protein [Ferruginibacter sp.]